MEKSQTNGHGKQYFLLEICCLAGELLNPLNSLEDANVVGN
jgi:hypothetical protein